MQRKEVVGRQVQLFVTPADLEDLESAIRDVVPVLVIADRSDVPEPRTLNSLKIGAMGRERLGVFLVSPEQLSGVLMRSVGSGDGWTVDALRSPVVEASRCYFDGKVLRRGRIYYHTGFYAEDGKWIEKPANFLRWAEVVSRTVRRTLTRDADLQAYLGREARRLRRESAAHFAVA